MVVLGKLGAAFGVQGWIKLHSYTEPTEHIFDFPVWYIKHQQNWQCFNVTDYRIHHKQPVVLLAGVNDRDAAQALGQAEVAVPKAQLPEPADDELYLFQLVGMQVINQQGECLGKVKELFNSGGGNQVLSLIACGGSIDEQKRLIPYVSNYILEVDLEAQSITVDWESDY